MRSSKIVAGELACVAAALAGATACTGIEEIQFVARVVIAGEPGPIVAVPSSVLVATDFEVTIVTYHGGGEKTGPLDVQVQGMRATVTPYTIRDMNNPNRPGSLFETLRTATLRFEHSGEAVVLFRGTGLDGESVEAERPVTVR